MTSHLEKVQSEAYPTANINRDLQMDQGPHTGQRGSKGDRQPPAPPALASLPSVRGCPLDAAHRLGLAGEG